MPKASYAFMAVMCLTTQTGNKTTNLTNTAQLKRVDQKDMTSSYNKASVSITVPVSGDIQVNQTQQTYTKDGSQYVTYTITDKNNGPNTATDVQITDILPAGLQYISHSISTDGIHWSDNNTAYNNNTGIWNLGNITSTEPSQILTITAKITATTGTIKNTAQKTNQTNDDWLRNNDGQTTILIIKDSETIPINIIEKTQV